MRRDRDNVVTPANRYVTTAVIATQYEKNDGSGYRSVELLSVSQSHVRNEMSANSRRNMSL